MGCWAEPAGVESSSPTFHHVISCIMKPSSCSKQFSLILFVLFCRVQDWRLSSTFFTFSLFAMLKLIMGTEVKAFSKTKTYFSLFWNPRQHPWSFLLHNSSTSPYFSASPEAWNLQVRFLVLLEFVYWLNISFFPLRQASELLCCYPPTTSFVFIPKTFSVLIKFHYFLTFSLFSLPHQQKH